MTGPRWPRAERARAAASRGPTWSPGRSGGCAVGHKRGQGAGVSAPTTQVMAAAASSPPPAAPGGAPSRKVLLDDLVSDRAVEPLPAPVIGIEPRPVEAPRGRTNARQRAAELESLAMHNLRAAE